jgi:hypothetical protein
MRSKIAWTILILALTAIAVAIAGWLGGQGVAGTVFLVICIGLGAYLGVGWGGKQAAETEKYRQEWLSKRKFPKTENPPDSQTEPESNPKQSP